LDLIGGSRHHDLVDAPEESDLQGTDSAELDFGAAIDALARHRVPVHARRDRLVDGNELDVSMARRDVGRADAALGPLGFVPVTAPGNPGHRFYVGFATGRWLKIDAKLEPRARRRSGRRWARVARHVPRSRRRVGPVVALLGPDGAGKGTVIEALRAEIPLGVTVVYLGARQRSPSRTSAAARPQAGELRESVFVLRKHARMSWALWRGYVAAWRGHVVLCDRHPLEALAIRPDRPPLAQRLERVLAERLVPRPDAIVLLDAPVDVLRARKQEQPPELLQLWRDRYRETFSDSATVVSTAGSLQETVSEVAALLWLAFVARRRPRRFVTRD
jgi:thymidylate kinase